MGRRPLAAAALVAVSLLRAGATARADDAPPPLIAVEGSASVDLPPDLARLTLGVTLERPTAVAATADVAKAAQAVVQGIGAEGIADKDVATGSVSLTILPAESGHDGEPPRPFRFQASTVLIVTVRPAERAGAIASRLVDRGANTLEGIDYGSSRADAVLDDLRARAAQDARHKAEVYVGALGLRLGRVLAITPGEAAAPVAPAPMRLARSPAPLVLPTRPGALTVGTAVTVRWEILQ